MVNPYRVFKDSIYRELARIGKAVANPKRLELLDLLCQASRTVEGLARETGLSVANTSQHLRLLFAARLVEAERIGQHVHYRIADPRVSDFFRSLRDLAEERLAEVEQLTRSFLEDKDEMEPIDRKTLMRRIRDGSVVLLDVRPAEEYAAGHITNAVSMPLSELADRLAHLPLDKEIVAYCRGPYCVLSIRAVEVLRQRGFRVRRLTDSVQDWRSQGLPVAN